jgi:hypothetical protein
MLTVEKVNELLNAQGLEYRITKISQPQPHINGFMYYVCDNIEWSQRVRDAITSGTHAISKIPEYPMYNNILHESCGMIALKYST